jgi:hypothetical protein
MLNDFIDPTETSHEPCLLAVLPENESMAGAMAAAVTAMDALREHGNVGVERNLQAGASLAALKLVLAHGEFGPFCTKKLAISPSYRARLLRLNEVKDEVPEALIWAATRKHQLAECQSAQNLIKLVNDWRNRDKPSKSKSASKRQEGRPDKDDATESEPLIQEDGDLVGECEKTISDLKSELTSRDDTIADLQRRLAECDDDFIALRDPLSDETRDQVSVALASSREHEFMTIAKRLHWRPNDLRREVQNRTGGAIFA